MSRTYSKISSLYALPEHNEAGTNTMRTSYFDPRPLDNYAFSIKSVNEMNFYPDGSMFMPRPALDKQILSDISRPAPVLTALEKSKPLIPLKEEYPKAPKLNISVYETDYANIGSPEVFGPALWFILHGSAAKYPQNPSPDTIAKMKAFILALPILIPCAECKEHASTFVEKSLYNLDNICSSQTTLFEFFVNFHNEVNKVKNKPVMDVRTAKEMYNGSAKIQVIKY